MEEPAQVSNSVLVTLFFAKSNASPEARQGFVVRFAVPPRVGDPVSVDQYSIRQLRDEQLHETEWVVADVRHELSLNVPGEGGPDPLAALCVTVHPAKKQKTKASRPAKKAAGKKKKVASRR